MDQYQTGGAHPTFVCACPHVPRCHLPAAPSAAKALADATRRMRPYVRRIEECLVHLVPGRGLPEYMTPDRIQKLKDHVLRNKDKFPAGPYSPPPSS